MLTPDLISTILWFLFFIVFIIFGPKLLFIQTIVKLEEDVKKFEALAAKNFNFVIKKISKHPTTELRRDVDSFLDFFAVEPVNLDPYGIVKKLDAIISMSEDKFNYFVKQIMPNASLTQRENIKNALLGAMSLRQLAKIVRHNFEIVKKYKMYQMALILQMQLPLVARIAKSYEAATLAFAEGKAIGDGIGPLVAAKMIKGKPVLLEKEEFVYYPTKMFGKNVIISKALGPGASTGKPHRFLEKIQKEFKIDRIITIDAGMRLEGEKQGTVVEGVGVALGGSGVERYEIEEFAVKNNIPLDAVIIKVSDEEALRPMIEPVFNAVPRAIESVERILRRTKRTENVLIIGVGNTCGVENSADKLQESIESIKREIKRMKEEEKQKKKKSDTLPETAI